MIKLMDNSQTYEVMDLWLKTTTHSNSFVEQNFWKKYYDSVKKKYIDEKDTFVYMQGGKIIDLDINEALDMPRVFDKDLYNIAMSISI